MSTHLDGEPGHLGQEIVSEGAANTSVGQSDELFLPTGDAQSSAGEELRIDIHVGHIVDEDRHPKTLAVCEDAVQEGRLARAEETADDENGEALSDARRREGRQSKIQRGPREGTVRDAALKLSLLSRRKVCVSNENIPWETTAGRTGAPTLRISCSLDLAKSIEHHAPALEQRLIRRIDVQPSVVGGKCLLKAAEP